MPDPSNTEILAIINKIVIANGSLKTGENRVSIMPPHSQCPRA